MSDRPTDTNASEPVVSAGPYRFLGDIRKILHVPPPATLVLFLATVIVFVGQILGGSSDWQWAVGLVPANFSDFASILRIGDRQLVPAGLTLFSYMFLHGGVFHLATNMAGLWVFGMLAEPVIGTRRFAFAYLAFGVITGLAIVALIPHWTNPMVGASGAISGILGAFLALRFSERPGRRNVAALLLEAIPLLAVTAWFLVRPIPAEPDRLASAAWHVAPFLAAWYGVRTWKGLSA